MGMTSLEKTLARASGRDEVRAGEIEEAEVDIKAPSRRRLASNTMTWNSNGAQALLMNRVCPLPSKLTDLGDMPMEKAYAI
jgi:hypothetical protein